LEGPRTAKAESLMPPVLQFQNSQAVQDKIFCMHYIYPMWVLVMQQFNPECIYTIISGRLVRVEDRVFSKFRELFFVSLGGTMIFVGLTASLLAIRINLYFFTTPVIRFLYVVFTLVLGLVAAHDLSMFLPCYISTMLTLSYWLRKAGRGL